MISRPDGKNISLEAPANSKDNFYVQGIKVDGKKWNHNYFRHEDLARGAKIDYLVASKPDTVRGTAKEDRPYSYTNEK